MNKCRVDDQRSRNIGHGKLPGIASVVFSCVLFCFLAGVDLVFAGDGKGRELVRASLPMPEEEKNIDIFPSQNLSTLLVPEEKPAPEIAQVTPPPAPPPPAFTLRGEWNDEGIEPHRVLVLEGFNQIFLLCAACSNDQAILPGGQLPGGYLFKQMNPQGVVLIGPDGQEQSLFI